LKQQGEPKPTPTVQPVEKAGQGQPDTPMNVLVVEDSTKVLKTMYRSMA
jgi:hypothetical protein